MIMTSTTSLQTFSSAAAAAVAAQLWDTCLTSNNQGVEFMKRGQFDVSSSILIRSLSAAKSILCNHHSRPPCDDGSSNNSNSNTMKTTIEGTAAATLSTTILPIHTTCLDLDKAATGVDLRGVYREVYVFPQIPTMEQLLAGGVGCTEDCLDTMCMAIVFNLALSHHLRAVCTNTIPSSYPKLQQQQTQQHINNSMALYELVYTMQQQRNTWTGGFRGLREEMYMGILCNLGHIHTCLGHHDKASQFFQHLIAIMVFLQSSSSHDIGGQSDQLITSIKASARETFSWCICSKVLQNGSNTAPAA
jgi:hypothetical protein